MFRQIIVSVTSAVVAQMAVATLDLVQLEPSAPSRYEPPRLAIVPGTPSEVFASTASAPPLASILAPVIGASQIARRN